MDLPKSTYYFSNTNYTLEQVLAFELSNRIDTALDCQRGYVWTSEQKQQLIDTLINRERIPEFHVIKEIDDSIFHFADGKQRITTILNFLQNKLSWEKSTADKKYLSLFGNKYSLFFKDLPINFQNMLLNTQVSFACYSNMTPVSITKLFRKLNNGTSLGSFEKGLAGNVYIKKYFLDSLMRHPIIPKIFSESKIEGGNAEQSFVRMMVLMHKLDNNENLNCDLRPAELWKYYPNIELLDEEEGMNWIKKLENYQNYIKKTMDWLNTETSKDKLRIKADYIFLMTVFFSYKEKLDEDTTKLLFQELRPITAGSILGVGADFNSTNVKKYLDYVSKIIH